MTSEDRVWFEALLAKTSQRNDSRIEELSQRIYALSERLDAAKHELSERIEATETRLLTEFHKWASPNEMRQRGQREQIHALDLELDQIRERLTAIERKLAS